MNGYPVTWSSANEIPVVVFAPRHLRRTVSIAVVVGTAFFAMNQLGVILSGHASGVVARKPRGHPHASCSSRTTASCRRHGAAKGSPSAAVTMHRESAMNETTMMDFVGRAVEDVGALLGGAMVVIGDKLGLYRAMRGAGSLSAAEVAARTGTAERYVREWLSAQAARGYISYDGDGRFSLPEEHAVALTDETSAACVIGAFEIALGAVYATDTIAECFRSCEGFGWGATTLTFSTAASDSSDRATSTISRRSGSPHSMALRPS